MWAACAIILGRGARDLNLSTIVKWFLDGMVELFMTTSWQRNEFIFTTPQNHNECIRGRFSIPTVLCKCERVWNSTELVTSVITVCYRVAFHFSYSAIFTHSELHITRNRAKFNSLSWRSDHLHVVLKSPRSTDQSGCNPEPASLIGSDLNEKLSMADNILSVSGQKLPTSARLIRTGIKFDPNIVTRLGVH